MLLTYAILVPLAGALLLGLMPFLPERVSRILATVFAAVPLVLLGVAWGQFNPGGPQFQLVTDVSWIPAVGAGFRLGVDGIALAVASMSALLFTVACAYPTEFRDKAPQYLAWMLFLEAVSLGLFLALDLLLFYVCFDLSLIGMYFLIAEWGHEDSQHAALKFILFTFAGSLVMLLGVLSLALSLDPVSFDMRVLIAEQPLAATGARAGLTLLALMIGLSVKTPLVPVHTWLPAAHVEAPAPVSTILAGVLLKMGTFGMIRVAYQMMEETFEAYSLVIGIIALISIVYGALVALGQRHIKRRIAYTSITHMGYTVLGIAAAASLATVSAEAKRLALNGAVLEMIAHGLITGTLFLLAGSLWQRGDSFEMEEYGGVYKSAPLMTVAMVVAAFASLGLPGLAGFVAEFQIFSGALATHPWLAGLALLGVIVTAALFLQLLQVVFFGEASERSKKVGDLGWVEGASVGVLLLLTIIIGVAPAFVLDVLDAASVQILELP